MALLGRLVQGQGAPRPGADRRSAISNRVLKASVKIDFTNPEHVERQLRSLDSLGREHRKALPVHVSTAVHMCERKVLLMHLADVLVPVIPSSAMQVIWEMGKAAERIAVNNVVKLAASRQIDLYGGWQCINEDHPLRIGGYPSEKALPCPKCGKPRDQYRQLRLFDRSEILQGAPDLVLVTDGAKHEPIEIKSINLPDFKLLERPTMDHVIQAVLYDMLLRHNDMTTTGYIQIWYVSKAQQLGKSPYKVYRLKIGEDMIRLRKTIMRGVRIIKGCIEDGTLPARICRTSDDSLAKQCNMVASCFNRTR